MRASVRMRMAAAALAVSGIFASPARAATAAETAAAAADAVVEAALRVAEGDRQAAWLRLVEGRTAADGGARAAASATDRRALDAVVRAIDSATARAVTPGASDTSIVAALRKAAKAARATASRMAKAARAPDVYDASSSDGFHAGGAVVEFRTRNCADVPAVTVESASPNAALRTFVPGVTALPRGRFRVTLGPDVGGVRVTATLCGVTKQTLLFVQGAKGAMKIAPPPAPVYAATLLRARAGSPAPSDAPASTAGIDSFEVTPPLPAGLSLHAGTGVVSGTALGPSPTADYMVVARNRRGAAASVISIQVTPPLPAGVLALEPGFTIEPVLSNADVPVKMAFAPDGRLFFNELATGNVRILRADGSLVPTPFATLPVLTGGERGLVGIEIAPDFATTGHVYVFAATPAEGLLPDRARIVRFTASGDTGTSPAVIVDSLPVAMAENGGDVKIGPDGKLYVSLGDTGDQAFAQTDGLAAGRILRFERDGGIPSSNPIPGDPEWCRGLRNPFDLAFSPQGGLYASENGPTAHDEIEYVQPGKNFEWGAEPESIPGPEIGRRMIDWTPVIVPTGITFLARGAFGPEYSANLFVAGYDQADLRRLPLSGATLTDVDDEIPFAAFSNTGFAEKPLDLAEAPDGSLYVSTFSTIWRIARY